MLELYHNDMAVCAAKVRMVLAEKGLQWTGHHLDLSAGETRAADYLRLNPNGVVPTLVDEGRVIIESTVICEYLDDKWRAPALRPSDPAERASMRLWTKQLDEGVHAATGAITYCISFRQAHLGKSPQELEAFLAKMPTQEQRDRVVAAIRLGMDAPQFAAGIRRFQKLFREIGQALATTRWLAGGEFSLAEVGYAPYLTRLEHLGLAQLITQDARVADWAERIKQRPSYQAGLAQWFNPSSLASMAGTRDAAGRKLAGMLQAA